MDFTKTFPLRLLINEGKMHERRIQMNLMLDSVGVTAERFRAVEMPMWNQKQRDSKHVNKNTISANKPRRGYACFDEYYRALTKRLAIREGRRRGAPTVFLMEDDIVLHPNFEQLIQSVYLPEDWGILHFGCTHLMRPEWAGSRIVKVHQAVDSPAFAVKAEYYSLALNVLNRHKDRSSTNPKRVGDIASLPQNQIPTYACYPNLAWRHTQDSPQESTDNFSYGKDGMQRFSIECVDQLLDEALSTNPQPSQPGNVDLPDSDNNSYGIVNPKPRKHSQGCPKLALLFLSHRDVNHPDIWHEFVSGAPDRVKIFSHSKHAILDTQSFLFNSGIKENVKTSWGDISLVKASRALLLAALQDTTITHFALLSESCVPVVPLRQIIKRLSLDPRPQFEYRTFDEAHTHRIMRSLSTTGIREGCHRFTSQWWLLDRVTATFSAEIDYTALFSKMFAPDEAYFATVLAMQGYPLDGNVVKKDVTWTHWQSTVGRPTEWAFFPASKLRELIHSDALFARKFPINSDIGKYALHAEYR